MAKSVHKGEHLQRNKRCLKVSENVLLHFSELVTSGFPHTRFMLSVSDSVLTAWSRFSIELSKKLAISFHLRFPNLHVPHI